jgi:hypothetical protein
MHLSKSLVVVGQKVKEGAVIAYSGNTGLSTGPHVHWDICKVKSPTLFSQFIDPAKWLDGAYNGLYYPKWVTVNVPKLYVRSQPTTKAPLSGVRVMFFGMRVRAVAQVTGESVGGNNKWYKSAYGNYFWSGGCK